MRTLVRVELLGAALRAGSGPLHLFVGGSDPLVHEWWLLVAAFFRLFVAFVVVIVLQCLSALSHPLRKLVVMVALLHPTRPALTPLEAARPRVARRQATGPQHLQLVRTQTKAPVDSLSVVAVIAIMATILLVVLVRGVQGAPPAADWNGLAEASAPAAVVQASETVTVLEGDTWATLAARVAPGTDPVEFARLLASDNGGYQLHVGQVLVVTAAD